MTENAYRRYLLGVLLTILAFNNIDGLALGLVLQEIKVDLALSDTQLGFLSGIAFAFFYSVVGIPIARWADRGNRVAIISATVGLWSAMVALSGRATSFVQLLLIRSGVAIGESGCIPPAHSLIADHFTRAERPKAMSIYMLGGSLSTVIGYFVAGWINQFYGWRVTFLLLGLPGLGLMVLAALSLREPRRRLSQVGVTGTRSGASSGQTCDSEAELGIAAVCRALWRKPTFRHLLFGFSVASFFLSGILQWQPTFFIRSYGLGTGEIGMWFALVYGGGSLIGTYAGGAVASRYAAHNEPLQLKFISGAYCGVTLLFALIYLAHSYYVAFLLMYFTAVTGAAVSGPLFATIQTLVPPAMRATSVVILYLFANLIGAGLGPLAAGWVSDLFRATLGEESLRYALLALSPGCLWAAWHVFRASKTVLQDVDEYSGGAQQCSRTDTSHADAAVMVCSR